MDNRGRWDCGPKAESPSGEPQLVWTPGHWPGLRDSDPKHAYLSPPSPQPADLLEWWESGVLHDRAGGDAEGIGGAEQMGGDGRAPRLLLGQWGLHDEAFPTAAAAPRAGVLRRTESGGSGEWGGVGEG